jgi:hypothetical protein
VTDRKPIRSARRKVRRLARLGSGPHVCPFCGCSDPVTLIPVTQEWLIAKGVPTTLFQYHHPLGEQHDPEFTILICRNCHAKATEGLLRADVSMLSEPDTVSRVVIMLRGSAENHRNWAAADDRMADLLERSRRKDEGEQSQTHCS